MSKTFLAACCVTFLLGCGGGNTNDSGSNLDATADGSDDATSDSIDVATTPSCDGVRRTFWTWDLTQMPPPDIQVDAGCRAVSDHAYVYAVDSVWPTQLGPTNTPSVVDAFEHSTHADPSRGIYAVDTSVFGMPPDVDHDPRIYLFYRNIGSFMGYQLDGFFRDLDESTTDPHSNQIEMLHLSVRPQDPASDYGLGVVAHEFVHLIASQYPTKDPWLSEVLGESGMVLCGYMGDLRLAQSFALAATSPLVGSSMGLDYGPLFLFADYLNERFGSAILGEIARRSEPGSAAVEAALAMHGGGTFRDLFSDWTVANFVDAPHPPYGYAAFDVTTEPAATMLVSGTPSSGSVAGWTANGYVIDLPAGTASADVTVASPASTNLVARTATYATGMRSSATVGSIALAGSSTTATLMPPAGSGRLALIIGNAGDVAQTIQVTVTLH